MRDRIPTGYIFSGTRAPVRSRFVSASIAGSIAIAVNTLILKFADLAHLATARGGLLRLIRPLFPSTLAVVAGEASFQIGFHFLIGIFMALAYAHIIEPALRGSPLRKGLIYAFVAWLLNAILVLPATGEGFAGSAHLTLAGVIWFAAAHTIFFVQLAITFSWLKSDA